MNVKKVSEYFTEIGIIEIKDIESFFQIYEQIDQKMYKSEKDILKLALFSYLNSISKNDKQLYLLCSNIINSYTNYQLIQKYKFLNIITQILKNKININYVFFLYKLSLLLLSKRKNKLIVQPVYYYKNKSDNSKNNESTLRNNNSCKSCTINKSTDRVKDEDLKECTFHPNINKKIIQENKNDDQNDIISYTYYTPSLNIPSKIPANEINFKNNTLENNFDSDNFNMNDDSINNINEKKSPKNSKKKIINSNFLDKQENHIKNVKNKVMNLRLEKYNKIERECTFNPQINANYKNLRSLYSNNHLFNDSYSYNNKSLISVNSAIKYNNVFSPSQRNNSTISYQTNEIYKNVYNNNNAYSFNNKSKLKIKCLSKNDISNSKKHLEKLYTDNFDKKIRNEERIREDMEKYTFAPEIISNDKYKITTTFEERNNKLIDSKRRCEKLKEEDEKMQLEDINKIFSYKKNNNREILNKVYDKEEAKDKIEKEKKKSMKKNIINWDKKNRENNSKYNDGKYFKKNIKYDVNIYDFSKNEKFGEAIKEREKLKEKIREFNEKDRNKKILVNDIINKEDINNNYKVDEIHKNNENNTDIDYKSNENKYNKGIDYAALSNIKHEDNNN